MGKLLKFEFRKVFKSKFFYIGILILVALSALMGYMYSFMANSMSALPPGMPKMTMVSLMISAISESGIKTILPIIIVIFTCLDFGNLAIRNIIARGYSREKIFFSKLIIVVFISLIYSGIVLLVNYLAIKIFNPNIEVGSNPEIVKIVMTQVLILLVFSILAFALSMILKKVAAAMASVILIPSIIGMIIGLLGMYVKYFKDLELPKYWFANYFNVLGSSPDAATYRLTIIGSIIYIVIFIVTSLMIWGKSEV